MGNYRIGSGYKASPDLETSVALQEILPASLAGDVPYHYYKLTLINNSDIHLFINNDPDAKFIRAGQSFEIEKEDKDIFSLKIVENGAVFNWFGSY